MPRGGARPGAGRKRKIVEEHRDWTAEARLAPAQRALDLCIQLMDNAQLGPRLRLEAAREVMDRVWGKPRQRQEVVGGEEPLIIQIVRHDEQDAEP